jgi:hypothetical protein
MKAFLFLYTVSLLFACRQRLTHSEKTAADSSTTIKEIKRVAPAIQDSPVISLLQTDSGNIIQFTDATYAQQYSSYLPGAGKHVYASILMQKDEILHAFIKPTPDGCNIRFNQTVAANGKLDGPYGRTLEYKASSKGPVTLVIGHNLMAEGVDSCNFTIVVSKE